jgi:hypothetical protein
MGNEVRKPPLTVLHLTDLHFSEPSKSLPSSHYWNNSREWVSLREDAEHNRRGLLASILTDLRGNGWTPDACHPYRSAPQ